LAELPREVEGFDIVEWLIIDDGSSDNTAEVARKNGVQHVIRHPVNRGLAEAFMTGIDACLKLGADVIINTDADNQYNGADIPSLTVPILAGEAEIVIGARPISETEHFSWIKKALQHLGSWAVRVASRTNVADAPSGFRAITREAAMRLNVFNAYTYTLETIIQAGQSNMRVISVPIRTNADLRPSRLVRSIRSYVQRSLGTIVRVFVIYRPLALFLWIGLPCIAFGMLFGLRFLVLYLIGQGEGHIQSVVLTALCLILGTLLIMMGLVADLIATNRKLSERILLRVQRIELGLDSRRDEDSLP
jgi:glycosyltransferase involved in cell wall biosynthesis